MGGQRAEARRKRGKLGLKQGLHRGGRKVSPRAGMHDSYSEWHLLARTKRVSKNATQATPPPMSS